jgi:signal transduction histidine kinase
MVAFSFAMGLMIFLLGGAPELEQLLGRLTSVLADERSVEDRDSVRLQAKLKEIHRISGHSVAIFTLDGHLLCSAGNPAPERLSNDLVRAVEQKGRTHHRGKFAIMLPHRAGLQKAYLIVDWHKDGSHTRLLIALVVLLLVLGLVSWPLARAIARPIERLTSTAEQLALGDLSARTGIERRDEIGVLARGMDHMARRIDDNVRSEKELLANVSHELRTPLARIKAALELAELPGTNEAEMREKLAGIAQDAGELEQLVSDVLTVSRLELGSADIGLLSRRELCSIEDLVKDSQHRFKRLHKERKLDVVLPGDLPTMELDAALIRRALDNLLDNAAKYSEEDQLVELEVKNFESKTLELEVRDRGIGVLEEDKERIFEPFFRAESSRSRKSGGVGLGLTLCRRILHAHGGSIEVLQREGGGSVFRITLNCRNRQG